MNIKDPRHDVPIWNSGCAALMCSVFAALLLETCNLRLGARPGLHVACALVFLVQAAAILRGVRAYRPGGPLGNAGRGAMRIDRTDLAAALALAALGYAGSAWLRTGWALAAALFATLLCVLPWSRIPLCRTRLPLAGTMTLLGGAALLCTEKPVPAPLPLLIPAWIVWMAAIGAWLRLVRLKRHKSRRLAAHPASG